MKSASAAFRCELQQDQEFRILFVPECSDCFRVFSQHCFDIGCRTVSTSNPHDTWNRTGDLAALLKVRVLGHDRETMLERVAPDGFVGGAVKSCRLDVR